MAKKEARQEPGNRKWKGTDLLTMQETYLSLIEGFHAQYGNHVLSGCELTGTNLSAGLVMLEGKACYFVGATAVTGAYYVRKVVITENVEYELTPPNIGWENYIAEACAASDVGAFRLDNAPRFVDAFKPKNAEHADRATASVDADTVDGRHASEFATATQGGKADTAVQSATQGGNPVVKVGTQLRLDALAMSSCSNRDFNTLTTSGYYYGHIGMGNAAIPDAISVTEVIAYSSDWIVQRQTTIGEKAVTYERTKHAGTTWSPWLRPDIQRIFITDWNNIPSTVQAGDVIIGSISAANSPSGTYFTAYALPIDNNGLYIWLSGVDYNGKTYIRRQYGGVWGAWEYGGWYKGGIPDGSDLNSYKASGLYWAGASTFNNPGGYGPLQVLGEYNLGYGVQLFTPISGGMLMRQLSNGTWGGWFRVVVAEANGDIVAFKS